MQNCLPELFDGASLRLVGEHLFRPRHTGHGRDAPLVAALHLVAVGLDDTIAPLSGAGHLRGADTAQAVRIFAEQVDAARERIDIVLELRALPSLDGLERFDKAVADGTIYKVVTTNLTYQTPELLAKPYYINCDMSKYIAYIIDTLNHDSSISDLLNPYDRIQRLVAKYKAEQN